MTYDPNVEKWRYEMELANKWKVTSLEAVFKFAELAIRGIILINGGAALALLAFFGHAVSATTNNASEMPIKLDVAVKLMPSMGWFLTGTSAGVITAMLAYFSQGFFTGYNEKGNQRGTIIQIIAIFVAFVGIAAFCYGGWTAVSTFTDSLESINKLNTNITPATP